MADYLLDANHASPLVTLHHPLRKRVFDAMRAGHKFNVCMPVLSEVWYGISVLPRAIQNRAEWRQIRQTVPCFQVDEADAEVAAELQIALRLQGRQLETVDALVAAIAIRYNLILLTTDGDFLPITQLKQENWR
jgi:predicted nucleic acid-binding protein